jgi:hypothetical protein
MKRIALVVISISVSGSSPTVISLPDGTYMDMALIPRTCAEDKPIGQMPIGVSTGPYIMKALSGDCWSIPYVNPNGSCGPQTYVTCPK